MFANMLKTVNTEHIPRQYADPAQTQTTQTKIDPDPAQTQTKIDPGQAETQTKINPDPAQTQTKIDPDRAETQTKIDPDQAQTQTKIDPDPARLSQIQGSTYRVNLLRLRQIQTASNSNKMKRF